MNQPNLVKGEEALYSCAECDGPVFLVDSVVYKPCAHTDAPVLANISAMAYGAGSARS